MNTGKIRTLRHVLLAVSALTGFHCHILLVPWPKWRLPAFIIFQDILCDFAYKLCKPMTIMFDAALKTWTKKRRQDIKIITKKVIFLKRYADDGIILFSVRDSKSILSELRKIMLFYPSNLVVNIVKNYVTPPPSWAVNTWRVLLWDL